MKTSIYHSIILLFLFVNLLFSSCNSFQTENIFEETPSLTNSSIQSDNNDSIASIDSLKNDSIQLSMDKHIQTQQNIIDSTKLYIYLTFDDGPFKGSEKINRIISEEQIKATVFIVGLNSYTKRLQQHIDDYKANQYIEVANHTFSHANRNKFVGYYKQPSVVLEDVIRNDSMFTFKNRFVRLPGRNVWHLGKQTKYDYDQASRNSANYLAEHKYYILGWDYEWRRLNKNHPLENPSKIYDGIVSRLKNHETLNKNHMVLLMHDDMFDNDHDAEKLRELIRLIKQNKDFIFEVASNYPIEIS